MKIWTRITLVTSVVVMLALVVYAVADISRRSSERRNALDAETREVAQLVRAAIEATGTRELAQAQKLGRALERATPNFTFAIIPESALTSERPGFARDRLDRLEYIMEVKPDEVRAASSNKIVYTLPLREPDVTVNKGIRVVGTLEVERSLDLLRDAWRSDLLHILPIFAAIVGLMIGAIILFTRRVVTHPINKLIAGMDDVAGGDLSRVLLSEREDEIGQLAARFNAMTASLRESREETRRQDTARRTLEEQLSQTEKLATIGQLAAEIAHEVGTPLNVIAGRARAMTKKATDPEKVASNASIIAEQSDRITRIIQRLLDFARRKVGTVPRELINLNQVTLTTMDFLEGKLKGAKVRSSLSREEGMPLVRGYPDQLQQVLINLLLNAVEATGDGGSIRVETYTSHRRRPGLENEPEQSYSVVAVEDDGPGIPPQDREKIFEPFYTSKDGRGGTGLGLAVSYGIVKDHDGWIEVDDHGERGTIFRIFLPAVGPDGKTGPLRAAV